MFYLLIILGEMIFLILVCSILQSDKQFDINLLFKMKQQLSSYCTSQPLLTCTQLLRKYKLPSKQPNKKNKTTTSSLNSSNLKESSKIYNQFSVKGKTIINHKKEDVKVKQNKPKSSHNKQLKQHNVFLGSVPAKDKMQKQKQNMISTLQVSQHTQLLTFYQNNVFTCHNQHNRFNKILKKKYFNQTSKTQYYPQQSQESFQSQRNFSLKHNFQRTSKIQVRRSSLLFSSQMKGIQLFEPRLKYKKRPNSVNNSKKYKMSSLVVKLRNNSLGEVEKTINVQPGHIQPLKYQDDSQPQITFGDKKIVIYKQPEVPFVPLVSLVPFQPPKRNIILKTQFSPPRYKKTIVKQKQSVTSGRGINPWSDEDWKSKNILDEQINVKLLA